MKKTSIKVGYDTLWALNNLVNDLSKDKGFKVTQDEGIRYLLEFHKKVSQNGSKSKKKASLHRNSTFYLVHKPKRK